MPFSCVRTALSLTILASLAMAAAAQDEAPAAEAPVEPTAAQQVYLDYLAEEGFRPAVDEEGDVGFKFEGGEYYVIVDEEDDQYYQLVYPAFWQIESEEERAQALAAAEVVSRTVKTGKIYIIRDRVWAGVESFVPTRDAFKPIFDRSLDALRTTWKTFIDEMREET